MDFGKLPVFVHVAVYHEIFLTQLHATNTPSKLLKCCFDLYFAGKQPACGDTLVDVKSKRFEPNSRLQIDRDGL